ncbi:GNAT family N-acetyltransferase [Enterococcus hermanniensis]|uniref:GNAT family N-acetyltransferase n=1 Tax=Enterococcus hermanniensis TaxID=249189 RepID=UPI0008FFEBDB|nr:N-acetyltransferase [Enterococcus hermanniensis]
MTINIRLEEPKDHYFVELITRKAFWNLYTPGAVEHLIVHQLRQHPDFIPELAFVIELDEKIIGSIFYSKSKVVDASGKEFPLITFGPVSIDPDYHRQGYGKKLIAHSIAEAKKIGYPAIVIGGFPYHYQPYGFVGTKKYSISMPDGKYYTGIMALPLQANALDSIQGRVFFSEAMEPDLEQLAAYDEAFPKKEKQVLECQAVFEVAVAEIDTTIY